MTTTAWIDCTAGASGDMLLGALVGAGVPLDTLQRAVDAVGVEPVRLSVRHVSRAGFAARKVDVECGDRAQARSWHDVRRLIEAAPLGEPVATIALRALGLLADAEARVHGVAVDEVHFHEVGALDSIADVVGFAAGLTALEVDHVVVSPVTVGWGTTMAAHGRLAVPPPAVVELLHHGGAPVQGGPVGFETCTPTAAALLVAVVDEWGPLPPMRIDRAGTGAGHRDTPELANVVRLLVGEAVPATTPAPAATAVMLSTNVDDLDPRLWPAVLAKLLAAGASDAWLTPILMKKGRPAHTLSVLTRAECAAGLRRIVFEETSTIGLRETVVRKHALDRESVTVDVDGEPVRVKLGRLDGTVVNAQPEYDDVVAAAERLRRPAKAVLAAAVAAAHALPTDR